MGCRATDSRMSQGSHQPGSWMSLGSHQPGNRKTGKPPCSVAERNGTNSGPGENSRRAFAVNRCERRTSQKVPAPAGNQIPTLRRCGYCGRCGQRPGAVLPAPHRMNCRCGPTSGPSDLPVGSLAAPGCVGQRHRQIPAQSPKQKLLLYFRLGVARISQGREHTPLGTAFPAPDVNLFAENARPAAPCRSDLKSRC